MIRMKNEETKECSIASEWPLHQIVVVGDRPQSRTSRGVYDRANG